MTLSTTNRYHWIGYSVAILVPVIGSVLITSGKD
ncbi:putative membrane protein [Klebsiella pneumoniae JHCK1]|nr:putative membrane protein [Klebsiella pneumoniae JHCK1]